MDKNGFKLNYFWTNGINRNSLKLGSQPQANRDGHLSFFYGSNDVFQSRFFTVLVITLVFIISLNLCLSFWIIKSLQVGNGGLGDGSLSATRKRITVKGLAKFNGRLTAEQINPVKDQSITIVGLDESIQLTNENDYNDESVSFLMTNSNISYQGPNFVVNSLINGSKQILFSINSDQLITNSLDEIKSTDYGFNIDEKVDTPSIKSDFYHDLRLEARTKGLNIHASSGDLNMKARTGPFDVNSFKEIILSSEDQLKIHSSNIKLASLPKEKHRHGHEDLSIHKQTIAYQVCICENGRLFLAPGNKACYLSSMTCSPQFQSLINEQAD
ncbi:zeta-sarcoglycan-like [Tetranychus urticae]|uniref:Uncharacterized protein n=1 Tax=Tetranychus urticae TaxID=32264 RepID=T1KW66_TETUR|nr:zeta-sarcoglycan-like [Tetranychus urticae]